MGSSWPFEPFRVWLRIRGDILNRKTTPRLSESATLRLGELGSAEPVNAKTPENPPHCHVPLSQSQAGSQTPMENSGIVTHLNVDWQCRQKGALYSIQSFPVHSVLFCS
jgi:hypothetical protein